MISCDVVGFSDVSEKGYCGTLYLRVTRRSRIGTFLLKSKAKLAPTKPILSIPRLELCGVLLLAKLYDSCMSLFNRLPIELIIFFTDSSTVLFWLRAPPHILKIFVANRVCQILEITDSRWNHVKSEDNPADLGARGVMPAQLENCQLWWQGPRWMRKPESEWPSKPISYLSDRDLPEVRQVSVGLHVSEYPQNDLTVWMENFAVYSKLIRTLAYALRFISNCSTPIKEQRKQGPISCGEFKVANTMCIRVLQAQFYPEDCEHDKVLAQRFNSLNVFKDQGGLLRVDGRIRHSTLPFEQKHPILLPRRCHFNDILVDYYHRLNLHAGPPEADFTEMPENRLRRWQLLRQHVQHFWSRWKSEYLTSLQQRTKWIKKVRNLVVGDLVLLLDFKTPPNQWPLARVTEVHPGPDGVVRVVTVKTAGGVYKRPVTKLCSLAPVVDIDANVKQ